MARLGKLRWRNRLMCDGEIGCFYSSANNVEELLAAGLVGDLVDSRNDLFEGIEELMAEILPGVSAATGSSREGPGMPFLRGKRSRKRKKA